MFCKKCRKKVSVNEDGLCIGCFDEHLNLNPLSGRSVLTPLSLSMLLKKRGIFVKGPFYWMRSGVNWCLVYGTDISYTFDYGAAISKHIFDSYESYRAYSLGELPDVLFRIFDEIGNMSAWDEWKKFCDEYYRNPANAWLNLERLILSI